ncbi:hypothetical protein GCM10010218_61150 [Streptomyces mashuensis]|uniref:Uncharacterized protein n=1 Tax=Streptomyces mashuensis TaxID=33904 RepID=A0A919B8G7_9ACTN|nr:hypothetical protein GCM10010218_61150 [Streptomyces mashuensis]
MKRAPYGYNNDVVPTLPPEPACTHVDTFGTLLLDTHQIGHVIDAYSMAGAFANKLQN